MGAYPAEKMRKQGRGAQNLQNPRKPLKDEIQGDLTREEARKLCRLWPWPKIAPPPPHLQPCPFPSLLPRKAEF